MIAADSYCCLLLREPRTFSVLESGRRKRFFRRRQILVVMLLHVWIEGDENLFKSEKNGAKNQTYGSSFFSATYLRPVSFGKCLETCLVTRAVCPWPFVSFTLILARKPSKIVVRKLKKTEANPILGINSSSVKIQLQ